MEEKHKTNGPKYFTTLLKKIENQAKIYANNHKNEYLKKHILEGVCYAMLLWEFCNRMSKKYENNTNREIFNFFNDFKKEIDRKLSGCLSLQGNIHYAYHVNNTLDFDDEMNKLSPEINKITKEIDKYENDSNK